MGFFSIIQVAIGLDVWKVHSWLKFPQYKKGLIFMLTGSPYEAVYRKPLPLTKSVHLFQL